MKPPPDSDATAGEIFVDQARGLRAWGVPATAIAEALSASYTRVWSVTRRGPGLVAYAHAVCAAAGCVTLCGEVHDNTRAELADLCHSHQVRSHYLAQRHGVALAEAAQSLRDGVVIAPPAAAECEWCGDKRPPQGLTCTPDGYECRAGTGCDLARAVGA